MYFNHQDKDISIIKGGKKKITRNKSYSWPGLPPYRVPLQPIASDDGTAMSKRPAMELDGRSGHWRESYSPTSRTPRCCLPTWTRPRCPRRNAMAIGDAGRVREEAETLGFCVGMCAERNQEFEGRVSTRTLIISTSSNLSLIFYGMGCKLMNLKPHILLYT